MAQARGRDGKARDRDKRTNRRPRKPKVCQFCTGELEVTEYRDARMLRRFISDTAKILPRRRTGVCARHQRRLATSIKRARTLAIIPFTERLVRR